MSPTEPGSRFRTSRYRKRSALRAWVWLLAAQLRPVGQRYQKPPDLVPAQVAGVPEPVKPYIAPDPPDVGLLRPDAVMMQPDRVA
jgi:hypothetical protein